MFNASSPPWSPDCDNSLVREQPRYPHRKTSRKQAVRSLKRSPENYSYIPRKASTSEVALIRALIWGHHRTVLPRQSPANGPYPPQDSIITDLTGIIFQKSVLWWQGCSRSSSEELTVPQSSRDCQSPAPNSHSFSPAPAKYSLPVTRSEKTPRFLPLWSSSPSLQSRPARSCCWCAVPNATGAFGDRGCFMWCKCIATDYISVPQWLAWMLWKSAKPSTKRKGYSSQFQNFP